MSCPWMGWGGGTTPRRTGGRFPIAGDNCREEVAAMSCCWQVQRKAGQGEALGGN